MFFFSFFLLLDRVHVEPSADSKGLDLVFRSIRREDGGVYSCEAILDEEPVESKFELKVIGKQKRLGYVFLGAIA